MQNIVSFRQKAGKSPAALNAAMPEGSDRELPDPIAEIRTLQTKAKCEIRNAIFMIDLALQHGRLVAKAIEDPAAKQDFDARLRISEQLLLVVREMAQRL